MLMLFLAKMCNRVVSQTFTTTTCTLMNDWGQHKKKLFPAEHAERVAKKKLMREGGNFFFYFFFAPPTSSAQPAVVKVKCIVSSVDRAVTMVTS